MAEFTTCPVCGALDQEVGKFCEQCGSQVPAPAGQASVDGAEPQADAGVGDPGPAPVTDDAVDTGTVEPDAYVDASAGVFPVLRFMRLENGVLNRSQAFDVPVGSRLLLGRTDPVNGIFPEVDLTMWSQRVPTPEGALYTVHRKQCFISRDDQGTVWIVDYADYVGDTMVSAAGQSQFQTIPSLAGSRQTDAEGAVALEVGDRILMGQGEGMLIFQLVQV
jgi:hypothetical protein